MLGKTNEMKCGEFEIHLQNKGIASGFYLN